MVQSVIGQSVAAAAVDTTVGDSASAQSPSGAGSLFNLTGLLDTVSANVELSGVPATDAPPAALALAALRANPSMIAAAVSKPLDVTSLSSVDAGLASLLMLNQTVSKGLVASAEAKLPTSGPAADLANISLTLKFNTQAPEMVPLVTSVDAAALTVSDDSASFALPAASAPLDGQAADPVAIANVEGDTASVATTVDATVTQTVAVSADPVNTEAEASIHAATLDQNSVTPVMLQPVEGEAALPVVDSHGSSVAIEAAPITEMPVVSVPDLALQAPVNEAPLESRVIVHADNGLAGGFKMVLPQPDQVQTLDPVGKVLTDNAGLGVLVIQPDETNATGTQDKSVLAALADDLKGVVSTDNASHVTAMTSQISAMVQSAGLQPSMPSATLLSSETVRGPEGEGLSVPHLTAKQSVETSKGKDESVKAQDPVNQTAPIVQAAVTEAAMVQQQAVMAAQTQVQTVIHQAGANQNAPAAMTRETGLAQVSGTGETRKAPGMPGALPRDGATGEGNAAAMASDQHNIQQIQQRDADNRDASEQQAGHLSAMVQSAGLQPSMPSATLLSSETVRGPEGEGLSVPHLTAKQSVETSKGKDESVKAQDPVNQTAPIVQAAVTEAAMVQQQAVMAAQTQVQTVIHQAGANQNAPAAMTRETGLAQVSGTGETRKAPGMPGALPRDGATGEGNAAAMASDQHNIQQIQQRDADNRDASEQQAGHRQVERQVVEQRNDEAQAVKAKSADVSTGSENGFSQSDQSANQGSQGKADQGQGLAHDASGGISAGGFVAEDMSGMTGVQSGSLVSGSLTSKAILTVQYALSGSSAGRSGPATAAEMRFQSLGQQVLTALRNNAQDIELTLNPSQLGQVILKLNVDGSKVRISAKTESKMTDDALKSGEEELKTSLLAQGFILNEFDVSHDEDRRRAPKAESEGTTVAQSTDGEAFSIDLIA